MGPLVSRSVVSVVSSNTPNIPNLIRSLLSRSVEIQISNKTQNIILRNPRIHFNCGHSFIPPKPELSPGSSDTIKFLGSYLLWGIAGVLVYEAESFTLAIHFSNPIDYIKFPMELSLELSPGKAHLGSLEDTYTRMAKGAYSSSCSDIIFNRGIVVGKNPATTQLSHGPVQVRATMSSDTDSRLKVVLEEQEGSGEEGKIENPHGVRPYQEK